MKKGLSMILIICLVAASLCVPAFADTASDADVVLRVSGETDSGDVVAYGEGDYTDFEEGWEAAIDLAEDSGEMAANSFERVVVDLYADWTAGDAGGVFGDSDGDGFQFSTIYFPDDVRVTLNLNGYTIDRGLVEWEYDGEVMYIDEGADVIINDGTITGGWSCNGAGGIHINDDANVVLNDVNVLGNCVEDDDGAGIAVYDGATLTMNGGCVSDNESYGENFTVYGGGVYIEDSSAFFTGVTFENNQGFRSCTFGAAIYVDDGTLFMDDCEIIGNGWQGVNDSCGAYTIIDILGGSDVTMLDTDFLMNGYAQEAYIGSRTFNYTSVIKVTASSLTMDGCTFADNEQVYLIESEAAMLTVRESDFTGNTSFAFYGNCANTGSDNTFTDCYFSNSQPMLDLDSMFDFTFYFNTSASNLTFIGCDFGEATFNDSSRATFVNSNGDPEHPGSIFGEGSPTMVISLLALGVSIASIVVSIALNKKRAVPAVAAGMAEDEE